MEDGEKYSLKVEANEVIKEIDFSVKYIEVSKTLENTDEEVHINMETKENSKFCLELSPRGFRIIGHQFDEDSIPENESRYFETIYGLLDSLSPGYRNAFGDALAEKLRGLQDTADHP